MLALAFIIVFGIASPVFAQSRRISIYRLDGEQITFDRGARARSEMPARQGQRLSEGQSVITGSDSHAYFQFDTVSIVKMDEQSRVSVNRANANNIALTVISGSALVSVETQRQGQTLEVRIGNTVLGVRGTLFVIGYDSEDVIVITMLDGSGVVDDTPLLAGSAMRIYEDGDLISDIDIEVMDLFTLQAIRDYQELLLDTGILSPDMLERVLELIDNLLSEREALRPVISPARLRREAARNPVPPRNSGGDSTQNATSDMPEGTGHGHGYMSGSDNFEEIMERYIRDIIDHINSSNTQSNTDTSGGENRIPGATVPGMTP
jgi:hypothetical protein